MLTEDLDPPKRELIDFAFSGWHPTPRSFADIGAVWRIDAAYTFYILQRYGGLTGHIVDEEIPAAIADVAGHYHDLHVHQGYLGDADIAARIGAVDVVLMYDILIHQVRPDWDQVLELYAPLCNMLLIFNPQYMAGSSTIRLLDLGLEAYFDLIPHRSDEPVYRDLEANLDKIHPRHRRPWRDIHNIWQWGITDGDLREKMQQLGFELHKFADGGPFGEAHGFRRTGYAFCRSGTGAPVRERRS